MPNSQSPQPEAGHAGAPASVPHRHSARQKCQVCGNSFGAHGVLPASLVRSNIAALIAQRAPAWDSGGVICHNCLNGFRAEYVRSEMERDRGELSAAEEEVMRSVHEGALLAENLNQEFDRSLSFGERAADRVAEFGGSWRFIITFFVVIVL